MQFKCKYGLIVKNISISSYSVYSIHFSISMLLVLFNPWIGPYQVLPLRGQSGPGSNGNEGVLRIPQSSSTAGISPSDCSVSYPGHSLGGGCLTPLQRCSQCILQPQPTEQKSSRVPIKNGSIIYIKISTSAKNLSIFYFRWKLNYWVHFLSALSLGSECDVKLLKTKNKYQQLNSIHFSFFFFVIIDNSS